MSGAAEKHDHAHPGAEGDHGQGHAKKKHKKHGHGGGHGGGHEEGGEDWLISYADMMTLLMGLFVILFSMATIDPKKQEEVKRATSEMFGGDYQSPHEKLAKKIKQVVSESKLGAEVSVEQTDEGITITFRGAFFFDSGSADPLPPADRIMRELIKIIKADANGFRILIEGHTDNVPIGTKYFASNWELSSVRACRVLRAFETSGFDRNKLRAIGLADTVPIVPNDDGEGNPIETNRSRNRRVVVKILKE